MLGELEAALHEGQPLGVAIGVGAVDIIVVVLPVAGASVIWGVNIYAVHFACIGKGQSFEGMVVLAVDDNLTGLVSTALNAPGLLEPSINWLIVFGNRHNVVDSSRARLAFVFIV